MSTTPAKVKNKRLYNAVKTEAKKRFTAWPSMYASAWLVKEYKRRGGTYTTTRRNKQSEGLTRWFAEDWRDQKGRKCGRKKAKKAIEGYPVCRPTVRVNKNTPKTWKEMSPSERKRWKAGKMRRGPNY